MAGSEFGLLAEKQESAARVKPGWRSILWILIVHCHRTENRQPKKLTQLLRSQIWGPSDGYHLGGSGFIRETMSGGPNMMKHP